MTPVNLDAIPAELRPRPQWVCWRKAMRKGKWTKIPVNPHTGRSAETDNPETWGKLSEALACLKRFPKLDGIGYVFSVDDPYVGVDLDGCLDANGRLKEWAAPMVASLDSYTQYSPSMQGLHVIVCGFIPPGVKHQKDFGPEHEGLAIYEQARFFTMSGNRWPGTPASVEVRQDALEAICREHLTPPLRAERPRTPPFPVNLDDQALLDTMFAGKRGDELRRLWNGDVSGFPSHSEADQSLTNALAFWTDRDAARIDALFRRSGLFRDKWEREDYRVRTIENAIAATSEGFRPMPKEEQPPMPGEEDIPPADLTGGSRYEANAVLYEAERAQRFAEKAERAAPKNGTHPPPEIPLLYSVADLRDRHLPEPNWAVEGFIPEGVTMLVAHSKIGKTFLAEDVAVAVALGGRAWGKVPVAQGKVIYLDTEGNQRRVQRRLRSLLGVHTEWPADLLMTHECVTLDAGGFRTLEAMVKANAGLRLLVLDTLNAMRPGKGKINDLVKEDYDLIRSLRYLGEEHACSIFLLHHCSLSKKDDSVNAGAGTHGLAAAASAVLTFKRTRGEHDAIMEITGNDITEEGKKHFKRDTRTGFWTLEGSADDFMKTTARQEVFDQLTLRGTLSPAQLAYALEKQGPEYEKLKKTMRRMASDGELVCVDGKYSIPTTRN